jgi:hypothetical protein
MYALLRELFLEQRPMISVHLFSATIPRTGHVLIVYWNLEVVLEGRAA